MARLVKSKSTKGGRVRTRVVTKIKRVKVSANRAARRARRAAGVSVSKKNVVITCAAGGVGAIGGALIIQKMPASVPDVAKNGIMVALGAVAAYKGFKKKNSVLIGAGIGAASVGVTGVVSSIKAGTTTAAAVSAPIAISYKRPMAAPFAAPVDYTNLVTPFAGAENDQI